MAPYLYCALMVKQELLVLSIGLGVGMAAMMGTLRFMRGWSLFALPARDRELSVLLRPSIRPDHAGMCLNLNLAL